MKCLIFDAGPIISLSMNGLLFVLEDLKKKFNYPFILTPAVYREVVDRPMKIKKFKLEALKVRSLIEKGVFTLSKEFVDNTKLNAETNKILKAANGVLRYKKNNEKITILHEGEASCLAFMNICECESLIVVDERTTRMLFESHDSLKNLIERKIRSPVSTNFDLIKEYTGYRFIRSAELIYVAYKNNLINLGKGKDVLDGLLYALKFKGTTISKNEIEYLKRSL